MIQVKAVNEQAEKKQAKILTKEVDSMTMNKAAAFGRLAPGVFAAVGYNGVGVARGTAARALLADLAVGAESELLRDVQGLGESTRVPPKPLLGLGVRARIAYYHWFERGER